jgi:amino acid transporter
LSYFEVTLSAKVLGVALVCEILILLVFDASVLIHKGFHGFSLDSFKPSAVFAGGFGVSLMLAFGSYVGFEATALYSEEAKDPHKTVPRATYISIAIITGFYLLTTWAAISAYGAGHAQAAAAHNPSLFLFAADARYVGGFTVDAMQILVVTSLFASYLAFTCNTARYHYALGRDGLLPRVMAHTHAKYGSPIVASGVQLALTAIVVIGFALAGQDPYLQMGVSLYGVGVLGVVLLQFIGSISVVGFFRKHSYSESKWGTLVAPALAAVGLAAALVLMVHNYSLLTGSSTFWINHLPWLLPVVAVLGAYVAHRVRSRHPGETPHIGDESNGRPALVADAPVPEPAVAG